MTHRSGFIAGVAALALVLAPALCCCASTAAADDGHCGGSGQCDRDGDPAEAPVPGDRSCPDERELSASLLPGGTAGKAAWVGAGDEPCGAATFEPARGGFVPPTAGAPLPCEMARAGPVGSLQALKTLLLI